MAMRSVRNSSVDTINAAATAIVSAEARVQPTSLPKKRWGSCWSLYWCFGYQKNSKRIGHAVLVPEPTVPGLAVPAAENQTSSASVVRPFIAPPSSPASFLPSEPPSSTQSPGGFMSFATLSANAYSPGGAQSMFTIGPYAYETQLVSPPMFSTYNTEPSTAPYTPPPESVQLTTPSSPEVPFAQLLTSSLERSRRHSSGSHKYPLTYGEFQPYQQYPGSPGGQLRSPGSAVSNSGTSSPFPDRYPVLEFQMGEAPKLFGYDNFTTHKWGSRLGSGSVTPDGAGLGSRLGSGTLTPDGYELGSRLASGSMTPNGVGLGSRMGSGCLTPNGTGPTAREAVVTENMIPEVASLANSESGCQNDGNVFDHRVSFELTSEGVACSLANKSGSSFRTASELHGSSSIADKSSVGDSFSRIPENALAEEEDHFYRKHRSVTLGSSKDFNFDNAKADVLNKSDIGSEWWANKNDAEEEPKPGNEWTFFPVLHAGVR